MSTSEIINIIVGIFGLVVGIGLMIFLIVLKQIGKRDDEQIDYENRMHDEGIDYEKRISRLNHRK
jgi:hypothetical protein